MVVVVVVILVHVVVVMVILPSRFGVGRGSGDSLILQLAGHKGVVFSEVRKGEPPVEFRMEGATWASISV